MPLNILKSDCILHIDDNIPVRISLCLVQGTFYRIHQLEGRWVQNIITSMAVALMALYAWFCWGTGAESCRMVLAWLRCSHTPGLEQTLLRLLCAAGRWCQCSHQLQSPLLTWANISFKLMEFSIWKWNIFGDVLVKNMLPYNPHTHLIVPLTFKFFF